MREAESGQTVVEVCRKYGISQQSYQNLAPGTSRYRIMSPPSSWALRNFVTLFSASTENDHLCASSKSSRVAPLAPLHIGDSYHDYDQEKIRSEGVGPRGNRVDGHKEDRQEG